MLYWTYTQEMGKLISCFGVQKNIRDRREVNEKRERNHANSVDNHNNSDVNFSGSSGASSNPKWFTSELPKQQGISTKQHMKKKAIWVKLRLMERSMIRLKII